MGRYASRRAAALLLLSLLLLSFVLPLTNAVHECAGECCAICQALEHSMLLVCTPVLCALVLSLGRAAVLAFWHTRAKGKLFYTPIILHVKLSD